VYDGGDARLTGTAGMTAIPTTPDGLPGPEEYAGRPPPRPARTTSRAARVELLRERDDAGFGLWAPADEILLDGGETWADRQDHRRKPAEEAPAEEAEDLEDLND
jgi:hypothetical protein